MKLITELLVLFGAISLVCCFPIDHTTARTVSARRGLLMLAEPNSNNNNADKFRTIKPSDIDSLFGNNSPKKSSITDDNDEDDDTDYDYFDDEEVSLDLVAGTISSASSANNKKADVSSSVEPAVMSTKSGKSTNSDTESQIMGELKALEDMGAFAEDAIANSGEEQDDLELSYVNLRKSLDKSTWKIVRNEISVTGADELATNSDSPRVFRYDPTDVARADPMQYGAYRRWKEAEMEVKKGGGNTKTKKQKKNNNKKEKDSTTDSFYNAIKNLGSGPTEKGTPTGTGFAEPRGNKSPITPKKAPVKKNKKKIITPDDIDSLFSNKNAKSEEKDEEEDDDDSEGLEEYENDVSDENSDKNKQLQTNKFNPMIGADEVIPQWLQDAEKAEKKRKAMKGKKQKKITDDWRFWISLIAGAGFVSAFVNIYQQTGGFGGGTGTDELII